MKVVIFAGGVGTRLWPLSRANSPKQFRKIVGKKSTLQLTVQRLMPEVPCQDIFISTNIKYKKSVNQQLPDIPKENFIFEPQKKDVGPAVALATAFLNINYPNEPMLILWSDHIVKKVDLFKKVISTAVQFIKKNKDKIVFIAQKPRFPNENLGWIHYNGVYEKKHAYKLFKFEGFKYKPDRQTAQQYFSSQDHAWNLGYFVSTPSFMASSFKRYTPNLWNGIQTIMESYGKKTFEKDLMKIYKSLEKINFDNAILEQLAKDQAFVIVEDLAWSDIGAWEALKEALEKSKTDNVVQGRVYLEGCKDILAYNFDHKDLVVAIDLEDFVVVNTKNVVFVSKKMSASKVKKIIEKFNGTKLEDFA